MYDKDSGEGLIDIFNVHEMYSYRSIINLFEKYKLFLLFNIEKEFRSSSYDCYAE